MPPMRPLLAAALVAAALLLQLSVLTRLPLPGATPDVVLLVVVGLGLAHGPAYGAGTGFGAGLALDLVPPADTAAGRWAFAFALAGYLAGRVAGEVDRSALVPVAVVALAAAGATLAYAGLGALVGDPRVSWPLVARVVPTAVLYDLLLAPVVVPAVLALARRSDPDPLRAPVRR